MKALTLIAVLMAVSIMTAWWTDDPTSHLRRTGGWEQPPDFDTRTDSALQSFLKERGLYMAQDGSVKHLQAEPAQKTAPVDLGGDGELPAVGEATPLSEIEAARGWVDGKEAIDISGSRTE